MLVWGKARTMGRRERKIVNPDPLTIVPYEDENRYTLPVPSSCKDTLEGLYPPPNSCPAGPHYLQISNWGDNGEEPGGRGRIWLTSQAVASKSPRKPGTPVFIDRSCPRWGGGPGGRGRGGSRGRSFCSTPCRTGEAGASVQDPGAHLGRARGTEAQAPGKARLAQAFCLAPAPGRSPRRRVPRERRRAAPAAVGDA